MTKTNSKTTKTATKLVLSEKSPTMVSVTVEERLACLGNRRRASDLVQKIRGEASLYDSTPSVIVTFEGTEVFLVLRSGDGGEGGLTGVLAWNEMSFCTTEQEVAFWRLPYGNDKFLTVNLLTDLFADAASAFDSLHAIEVALRMLTRGASGVGLSIGRVEGARTAAEYTVYEVVGVVVRFTETSWYTRYDECRSGDDSYSGRKTKTAASARRLYRAVAEGKLAKVATKAELETWCSEHRIALESFHSVWR